MKLLKRKSDDKLRAASEHIHYEIIMLHHTMISILQCEVPADRNAMLESYAIHVRNLIEFIREPTGGSYVRAVDYLNDDQLKEWRNIVASHKLEFDEAWKKASEQVAHLTYQRTNYIGVKKAWKLDYCFTINACLSRWVELIPSERVIPGMKGLVMHFQENKDWLKRKIRPG